MEEFRLQIAGLNRPVKELSDENPGLNRGIKVQNIRIKCLKAENSSLKERLSLYEDPEPQKNSGNSSVPPSKEGMGDEVKRSTMSLRERSGRKPGVRPLGKHTPHGRYARRDRECAAQLLQGMRTRPVRNRRPGGIQRGMRGLQDHPGRQEVHEEDLSVRMLQQHEACEKEKSRVLGPLGKRASGLSQCCHVHALQQDKDIPR